jgi:hypothetical protein
MKSLQDIQSDILTQLQSQLPVTYSPDDILDQSVNANSPYQELIQVNFDEDYVFGLSGLISFCSSLVPNSTVGSVVAEGLEVLSELINSSASFSCAGIAFSVIPAGKTITGIRTSLAVEGLSGILLNSFPNAQLTITSFNLNISLQGQTLQSFNIGINGILTVGSSTFGFFVDFQSLQLQLQLLNTPGTTATPVTDLFNSFSIQSAIFAGLNINSLFFSLDVLAHTLYTELDLATSDGSPVVLIDNVLSINDLGLVLQYAPSSPAATISSTFTLSSLIALNVLLSYSNTNGTTTWVFSGGFDLGQTQANYTTAKKYPGSFTDEGNLLVSALLDAFDPTFKLPATCTNGSEHAFLQSLFAQGTIQEGGSTTKTYQFQTTFGLVWQIGGNTDELTTSISLNGGSAGSTSGSVSFTLEFDGVEIDFEYDFGDDTQLTASIQVGNYTITGAYDFTKQTVELTFSDSQSLSIGDILAMIANLFTGNPNIGLSSPWDELDSLGSIDISKLKLKLDFSKPQQKSYTLDINTPNSGKLFGLITINGVTISYVSGEGLSFSIDADFSDVGGPKALSPWDPTNPAKAPSLPGKGAQVLDIQLVAAGQNVSLPTTPATIQDAITAIQNTLAIAPDSTPAIYPTFGGNGWLLGIHLLILNQVDLQLVFDDPDFYGASIQVNPSNEAKPTYLDALAGLNAQITYRKINNTVGVYDASLILPASIKNIDYGFCKVELPLLAVQIYTDGGFLIDVGYPYNDDFSQSVNIFAGEYTGAGGFYFGRLSPQDAPPVPQVDPSKGSFGTLTEIGIGIQFGIYESFSSGPFSAQLSALIQGLLQGAYAPFYLYESTEHDLPKQPDDYYSIDAIVSVSGKLQGTVDFIIIKANVLVDIELTVNALAEAYKQTAIAITATLNVDLSVTIDMCLFTITKSFSFIYDLNYQALLGSDSSAPWSSTVGIKQALQQQQFNLHSHFKPFPAVSLQIPVYILPTLTLELASWAYVIQFAMPSIKSEEEVTFFDFASLILAWFVQAYNSAHHINPVDDINNIITNIESLKDLQKYLQQASGKKETVFDTDELAALFSQNLQLTLVSPGSDFNTPIVIFPVLPNVSIEIADTLTISKISEEDTILKGYMMLTIQTILGYIVNTATHWGDVSFTLGQLTEYLTDNNDELSLNIEAMVSRYMLHGTQVKTGKGWIGLYTTTGQQQAITEAILQQQDYGINITSPNANWGQYGIIVPTNDQITLTSEAGGSLFNSSAIGNFAKSPAVASISTRLMKFITRVERPFKFTVSTVLNYTDSELAGALAPLPRDFLKYVSANAGTVQQSQLQLIDPKTKSIITDYALATTISFTVKQISMGLDANKQEIPAYSIISLDTASYQNLVALVQDLYGSTPPILTHCWLACTTGTGNATTVHSFPSDGNFFYQANLSTESTPGDSDRGEVRIQSGDLFYYLDQLLAAAITNSGGVYLRASDFVAPSVFTDTRGMGTLSLIVVFESEVAALPSYLSGLIVNDMEAGDRLLLTVDDYTVPRPTMANGVIGFELKYKINANSTNARYQLSINNLFHLCSFQPTLTHQNKTYPLSTQPLVSSPTTPVNRTCSQTLDLMDAMAKHQGIDNFLSPNTSFTDELMELAELLLSDVLMHPAYDPYQYVGDQLELNPSWVDIFGNSLLISDVDDTFNIPWTDPLVGLNSWPGLSVSYGVKNISHDLLWEETVLQLHIDWRPPSHITSNDLKSANRYRLQYAKIYHQLNSTYTWAFVDSSMLPEQLLDTCINKKTLITELRTIAWKILIALDTHFYIPDHTVSFDPINIPLKGMPFNTNVLFPLSINLHIQLNPDYLVYLTDGLTANDVNTACNLQPRSSGEGAVSLEPFARDLEKAMETMDYKVMNGNKENSNDLWILRYGATGLQINLQTVQSNELFHGYAPPPVMTELYNSGTLDPSSYNTFLTALDPDNIFALSDDLAVSNLDTDKTFATYLIQLEQLLTAKNAMALSASSIQAVQSALNYCQQTKYLLAFGLPANVLNLHNGEAGNVNAQNAYTQAMLKRATNFYDVDAVALLNTTLQLNTAQDPDGLLNSIGIYGEFLSQDNNEIQFSAVEGIINLLDGQLSVNIMSQRKGLLEAVTLPGSLQIKAFEINMQSLSINPFTFDEGNNPPDYRIGEWIRFVIPPAPITSPQQEIGLPMRAFPKTPVITAQGFSQPQEITSLEDAKSWLLQGTYRHNYIAQDAIKVRCIVNTLPPVSASLSDTSLSLVNALSLYSILAEKINPYLSNAILEDETSMNTITNQYAVEAFAAISQVIAQSTRQPVIGKKHLQFALGDGPGQIVYSFYISEAPADINNPDTSPWQIQVQLDTVDATAGNAQASDFIVNFPGYSISKTIPKGNSIVYEYVNNNNQQLVLGAASVVTQREVSLGNNDSLNILGAQNGQLYFSTLRNGDFPTAFQYKTQESSLSNAVIPAINSNVGIDISQLSGNGVIQSLSTHLANFLQALVQVDTTQIGLMVQFQMVMGISFPWSTTASIMDAIPNTVMAAIPNTVMLQLATSLPANASAIDTLITQLLSGPDGNTGIIGLINNWISGNGRTFNDIPETWNKGQLCIELEIYSDDALIGVNMPILVLNNIYLSLAMVSTIS